MWQQSLWKFYWPLKTKTTWLVLSVYRTNLQSRVMQTLVQTFNNSFPGPSLVALVKNCLSMQETRVQSLSRGDPTCDGAAKPAHHHCWACALEPVLCTKNSRHHEKPTHRNWRVAPICCNQRKPSQQRRHRTAKNKKKNAFLSTNIKKVCTKY